MDSVSNTEPISIGDVLPDVTGNQAAAPVEINPNAGKEVVSTQPLAPTQALLDRPAEQETPVLQQASDASELMQQLVHPPTSQSNSINYNRNDPATLSQTADLMSQLASQDPVPVKPLKHPHPMSYEQGAQEAREAVTGKVQPTWRSGWNVPHREKLQYLAPVNPFNRNIADLREPVLAGLYDLRQLAQRDGYDIVIESGKDGKHAENSFHYAGEAIDINFKKDGRNATYDKKALELFKKWAWQSGFGTLYDEAHHYDAAGNMGAEKPNAHFHLTWGEDAKGMPGSFQFGTGRKSGAAGNPIPHSGQTTTTFADVQPLIEAHDYKTMPGKAAHAADVVGVDPRIFSRLIQKESNFKHNAVSPVGAAGAAQLMPETAEWLAKKYNIPLDQVKKDPYTNMKVGARYLAELTDQFGGNYVKGIAAYNMGPGALQSYLNGKQNLPSETRNYVYGILKDLYPDQFKSPESVDYALKNGSGPTRSSKTYTQARQEELRAVATPGQRVINGLLNLVPYGMRPGDGLLAGNVPEKKVAERNKTLASQLTPDLIENMAEAQTGVLADAHNAMAEFLHGMIPFGLVPNWREQDIHDRDRLMGYIEEGGGFMQGMHKLSTEGLPWFLGAVTGFNKLLKGAGMASNALKGVPILGKIAAPFAVAAEAELSSAPLGLRYIKHLTTAGFKDSSKFFNATVALGSLIGLDSAGRHFTDWWRNSSAGKDDRDLGTAVRDTLFTGSVNALLGGVASIAVPVARQTMLSTLLRSPDAAGALGKALSDANPAKAAVKRAAAGSIGGLVLSQGLVNPVGQMLGLDVDVNPLEGMTAGALLSGAGVPVMGKFSSQLEKFGLSSNHPAMQAMKIKFDKWWDGLDDVYKNNFTKPVIEAAKSVQQRQYEAVKISKVRNFQDKVLQLGQEMQPTVDGMTQFLQEKQTMAQSMQKQAQIAAEQAKKVYESLPPEKQNMVGEYQQKDAKLQDLTQKRDALVQQMNAMRAAGDADGVKNATKILQPLQKETDALTAAKAQIIKDYPEVPRVIQLGRKAQQIGQSVQTQLPDLQAQLASVGPAVEKAKQFQQNLLNEHQRLQGIPDDAIIDPGFKIGNDTELVKVEHMPGEFPDLPGIDKDQQARVATETLRNSMRELVGKFDETGTFFDKELLMQGRKFIRDSTAGYQGTQGHDMSLFNSILDLEAKSKQKTSVIKKELFGEKPIAISGNVERNAKKYNALQYEITKGQEYGYVNAEVILDAAKKQGFKLDDPILQKMKSDLVNKGTGIGKSAIVPSEIHPSGETFAKKGLTKGQTTFQKFNLTPENVADALAAQAIGDTHVPFKVRKGHSVDLGAFTNQHAEDMIKDMRDNYTSSASNIRDYMAKLHPQEVMKKLPGFASDDPIGGNAAINETWFENSLDKRLSKRMFEKLNGFRPTEQDIVLPLTQYMEKFSQTPKGKQMVNDMVSEEIRAVASMGMDIAGLAKQGATDAKGNMIPNIKTAKGDIVPDTTVGNLRVAKNENGTFVVDAKGKVQFRQRNAYAGGVARQRLALELPDTYTHPDLLAARNELSGPDAMSFINNEQYMLRYLKNQVNEWSNGGKTIKSGDIMGHSQESFGRDVYAFRVTAAQIGDDIHAALDKTTTDLHSQLKLDKNPTLPEFTEEAIDALEDGKSYSKFIQKYGEIGKQVVSNHLSATQAMTDFNKSCEFNRKFARDSFFMHNHPELMAHIKAATASSDNPEIALASALDRQRRLIPTMAKAREVLRDTEKFLEGKGIDRNKYLKMTPEKRAQVTNPDVAWDNLTRERKQQLIEEANQKATNLLLRSDLESMTPGKMIANRLRAMASAESMRRFISHMMDSPTLDKEGNPRYLVRVRDQGDVPVVTFPTPKGDRAEQQLSASGFFGGTIDLKGKPTPLKDVYAHPEVVRFLNDYASSVELNGFSKAWNAFNRHSSAIRLLGSWIPHMVQTTTALMPDMVGNIFDVFSPSKWNLSGAGKKIREGDRGRMMELFAYRTGLNARHLMENTIDISNNILESVGDDLGRHTFGVGDNAVTNIYAASDPNNPARKEVYKAIDPISRRAADIFSVPLEVEKATMRHILYGHIRDAQLAAHYVRTNQMMLMEGGSLSNVSDPMKRLALASQGAATMSNSNVGAMPYYLFDKSLRDWGQKLWLTPGWGMSIAHTMIDGMSGILGLGNSALAKLSPGTAEQLEALGRKLVGDKPLYANVNPATRDYIRNRMAKNLAGLVVASAASVETFNLMVNGRASYEDPDASKWGKMRIGNTYYSSPLFGYVKKMSKLFYAGAGSVTGKADDAFHNVLFDQLTSMLSPFAQEVGQIASAQMGSRQAKAEEMAVQDDNPILSLGKRAARTGFKILGGQELLGFRQDADPADVMAMGATDSSSAARLAPNQYVSRVMSGVYDSEVNIPRGIRGHIEEVQNFNRMQLSKQIENFFKAAMATSDKAKQQELISKAKTLAVTGIVNKDKELAKIQPRTVMSQEAWTAMFNRYFRPAAAAMQGADSVDRILIGQEMREYQKADIDPYQSLIPAHPIDGEDEE